MSSSILQTKRDFLSTIENRGKFTITIFGCGKEGLLQACLLAEAGYKIICADPDAAVVNNTSKGKTTCLDTETESRLKALIRKKCITATDDPKTAASQSDIIIIAVPVKIDGKSRTDYSEIENACRHSGPGLRRGALVIVSTPIGLGITYGLIRETLENASGYKAGTDLGLAYSPLSVAGTCKPETLANSDRLVAAADKNSLEAASVVLSAVSKELKRTDNIKQAEAAMLFGHAKYDTDVALAKELAFFCEKAGIDYSETSKLVSNVCGNASTSPALASDGTPSLPYILLEDAENLNAKLRITVTAREINEETASHAANLLKDSLHDCGKTFRRARVAVLGLSQTPNAKDHPKDMARRLVKALEDRGAKVSLYDPYYAGSDTFSTTSGYKKNLPETVEGTDCIIILTGHDQFRRMDLKKLKLVMRKSPIIVDLERIIDPKKAEKEGFIYRGLGRGAH